jgi:hypothetical protein
VPDKENLQGHEIDYIIPRLSHIIEPLNLEKALKLKNKVEAALNNLTDAQQFVIYHAFYEGLTQEEIAQKLKIPVTTVQSKVRTSLISFNEKLTDKPQIFSVQNESIELIYPYVLGCLSNEEQLKTYNTFKASEPFQWKTLGDYQNLVSLLPIILDLEEPPQQLREKIVNRIYQNHLSGREKEKTFEPVSPAFSQFKKEEDTPALPNDENTAIHKKFEKVENLSESGEKNKEEKGKDFEQVTPFRLNEEKKIINNFPDEVFDKKRNYTSIIIIVLIILFVGSAAIAYLFYRDKSLYYENQIENLNNRMQALIADNNNRPEIPGLGELKNPQTVQLENTGVSGIVNGRIILCFEDKRGYLYISNLPILSAGSAYQLWGNFEGDFISLGVFKVSARPDYYPFTLPESAIGGPIEFYLIESNAEGSRKPGSKVYLKGKIE